jgi:hypothetical protein
VKYSSFSGAKKSNTKTENKKLRKELKLNSKIFFGYQKRLKLKKPPF